MASKMKRMKSNMLEVSCSGEFDDSFIDNYSQSMVKFLQNAWCQAYLCDFTIYCRNNQIKLHRLVLAAHSVKFHEIFKSENPVSYVIIDEVKEEVVQNVVRYLYTGILVSVKNDDSEIFQCAKQLGLERLLSGEKDLTVSNVVEKLVKSNENKSGLEKLVCLQFISDWLPEVSQTLQFLQMPVELLCYIFNSQILREKNETEKMRAVLQWLKFDPSRRQNEINRVLSNIRFSQTNFSQLCQELSVFETNSRVPSISQSRYSYELEGESTTNISSYTSTDYRRDEVLQKRIKRPCLLAVYGRKVFSTTLDECLNSKNETETEWQEITTLPEFRNHPAVVYLNDYLYIIGGTGNTSKMPTNLALSYHLDTGNWSQLAPMQEARSYAAAAILKNKIFVVGGRDKQMRMLNSMEVYDIEHDKWDYASPASAPCVGAAVTQYIDRLYRIGGDDGKKTLCLTEVYDPERDMHVSTKWLLKAPLREDLAFSAAIEIRGSLYLTGGAKYKKGYRTQASIKMYHPINDEWQNVGELSTPRCDHGIINIGTKFYVISGFQEYSKIVDTVECYDTSVGSMVRGIIRRAPLKGPVVACLVPAPQYF